MAFMRKRILGNCMHVLSRFPDNTFDCILTDPPYGLGFMSREWDKTTPRVGYWRELLRVAKPGAFFLCFGGTRMYHRVVCAIEDSGWIIKDSLMWLYGGGFPKAQNVGRDIDKLLHCESEVVDIRSQQGPKSMFDGGNPRPVTRPGMRFDGYHTALKPAFEPIVLAMKPLDGTYAKNALKHGVAGLNIDAARISTKAKSFVDRRENRIGQNAYGKYGVCDYNGEKGRWPANVIFSHSPDCNCERIEQGTLGWECVERCPVGILGIQSRLPSSSYRPPDKGGSGNLYTIPHKNGQHRGHNDNGTAARFFYCAKASPRERGSYNNHPTVKPPALLTYLLKLIAPPGNPAVLDPFMGSGSTIIAALRLGLGYCGIEKDKHSFEIARRRLFEEVKRREAE